MEDRKRKEKVGKGKCYWITYDQLPNEYNAFSPQENQKNKK